MNAKQNLAQLRAQMDKLKMDAYIVPQTDCHQSEYLPLFSQRLTWLTGFTGSAGLAIITHDRACIFVDGRYSLQICQQTDQNLYESSAYTWPSIESWVQSNISSGMTLGFDPWLLTEKNIENLTNICNKIDIKLKAHADNLIDHIWHDRPKSPQGPIRIWPLERAGQSLQDKLQNISETLRQNGADTAVLSQVDSINWLLNIRGCDIARVPVALAYALVHRDETVDLFIDCQKMDDGLKQHLGSQVRLFEYSDTKALLPTRLTQKNIMIDPASAPYAILMMLQACHANIIRAPDVCMMPKAIKNKVEIDGMEQAHLLDGVALVHFFAWLEHEMQTNVVTEIDTVRQLAEFRSQQGCLDESFGAISGSGPNGAIVHYQVTQQSNRSLNLGEVFLMDSGGQYLSGTTDVTRTVLYGHPTVEQKDRYTRVLRGFILLSSALFPEGTSGHQLDALARYHLWQQGLNFNHGTGHGVGSYLCVHEGPHRIASVVNTVALQVGMVTSIEPGYYKADTYGIRIENLVVVAQSSQYTTQETPMLCFKPLTYVPIDRRMIDISALNADERAWLDAYHAQVYEKLHNHVQPFAKHWLKCATQPL